MQYIPNIANQPEISKKIVLPNNENSQAINPATSHKINVIP